MIYTKPCGRGGCTATVTRDKPSVLAKTTYCGKRCAYIERLRHGWNPAAPLKGKKRPEHVTAAVMKGRVEAYRKMRARKAALLFEQLAPRDVKRSLSQRVRDLAAVQMLLVRATEYGYRLGRLSRAAAERRQRDAA